MCKLRSYKHSCGHTTHRPISACRFTYATNDRALCHASPDLTITLPDACRTCLYRTFCETWENRIADARTRQSAARANLRNTLLEEPDDDLAWGGFSDGTTVHARFSDYTDAARRRRDAADREVEQLWAQYQREQWTLWRPLVTGPNHNTESPNKQRLRRRRTSRRCSGDSPLRLVTSAEEYEGAHFHAHTTLPEEEEEAVFDSASEASWFPADTDAEEEEEEDGGTLSPNDTSDDSDDSEDDEKSIEATSPRTPPGSQENLVGISSWAWPTHASSAAKGKLPVSRDPMKSLRESLRQWAPEIKVGGGGVGVGVIGVGVGGRGGLGGFGRVQVAAEEDLQLPDWGMA